MATIDKDKFTQLKAEIESVSSDPVALKQKIKDVSDALDGKDFKIARNLNELYASITVDKNDTENFTDIRNKLLYLTGQILEL